MNLIQAAMWAIGAIDGLDTVLQVSFPRIEILGNSREWIKYVCKFTSDLYYVQYTVQSIW